MTKLATAIRAGLQRDGLAVCSVASEAVGDALSGIGDIVEQTQVRQIEGATTYLCGHDAVPLHTDHPEALVVAWWCEAQAERDGASVLADGHSVLSLLGDQAEALQEVEQHVPPQLPGQVLLTAPVWSGERLYYAPWYPVLRATGAGRRALRTFRSLLAMGSGHKRVRLQPGELLVVDNGRWLHGRDKLEKQNGRLLRRFWLQ
jgi:hypothetical protein